MTKSFLIQRKTEKFIDASETKDFEKIFANEVCSIYNEIPPMIARITNRYVGLPEKLTGVKLFSLLGIVVNIATLARKIRQPMAAACKAFLARKRFPEIRLSETIVANPVEFESNINAGFSMKFRNQ